MCERRLPSACVAYGVVLGRFAVPPERLLRLGIVGQQGATQIPARFVREFLADLLAVLSERRRLGVGLCGVYCDFLVALGLECSAGDGLSNAIDSR